MAPRPVLDLLVFGADAAGFAAAACAARSGAKVALVPTGGERAEDGLAVEPPNFVWRLLDLHQYALRFDDPAAETSTLADGSAVTTLPDAQRTADALAGRAASLEHLWPAFVAGMEKTAPHPGALAPTRFDAANDALDDYFDDEALKTHLVNALVSPFGLAGDEAGSAQALQAAALWGRRRALRRTLAETLRGAALNAGVDIREDAIASVERIDGKHWKAILQSSGEIRARDAMASSALLGEAAGLRVVAAGSPLLRRAGAEATIRIRYDKRPKLGGRDVHARYHTAAARRQILSARNAMAEGRLPDDPPMTIEFSGKDVIVRAPYCPARIHDNGAMRDWTGQDRQILGRQAVDQVERLFGDIGVAREIDVIIGADVAQGLRRRSFATPPIAAPAPSLDDIGAAAALAMEIVRRD